MTPVATKSFPLALLALLLLAPPAAAQLELDQDGNVGVGQPPRSDRRLTVQAPVTPIFGDYTGTDPDGVAVRARATAAAGAGMGGHFVGGRTGLLARGEGNGAGYRTGLYAQAMGGTEAMYGVVGSASGGSDPEAGHYGLYGLAYGTGGPGETVGVYGRTENDGPGVRYTFYASEGAGTARHYAAYFNGPVSVNGEVVHASDGKFKKDVEALAGAGVLEKVKRLKAKKYKYKQSGEGRGMGFSDRARYGFVAQEVEAVFPELVTEEAHLVEEAVAGVGGEGEVAAPSFREVTYKALNYTDLIPLLVQALQEQQGEIEALREALEGAGIKVKEE